MTATEQKERLPLIEKLTIDSPSMTRLLYSGSNSHTLQTSCRLSETRTQSPLPSPCPRGIKSHCVWRASLWIRQNHAVRLTTSTFFDDCLERPETVRFAGRDWKSHVYSMSWSLHVRPSQYLKWICGFHSQTPTPPLRNDDVFCGIEPRQTSRCLNDTRPAQQEAA